jgi:hypothetical protein
MKKLLLLVVVMLSIGYSSVSAQAVWGGRVGLSRPTISGKGLNSTDGKFGLELGPVLYYSLKNNFYLNSGAMFSLKTFDFDDESLNMVYLDIPLYAGYSFPISSTSLYAQAGPFVGIKLAESGWEEEGGSGLNTFNAGVGIMAGVNLNRFKVELGYQAGLMNVIEESGSYYEGGYYYSYDFSAKLGSIFIGVSYVF